MRGGCDVYDGGWVYCSCGSMADVSIVVVVFSRVGVFVDGRLGAAEMCCALKTCSRPPPPPVLWRLVCEDEDEDEDGFGPATPSFLDRPPQLSRTPKSHSCPTPGQSPSPSPPPPPPPSWAVSSPCLMQLLHRGLVSSHLIFLFPGFSSRYSFGILLLLLLVPHSPSHLPGFARPTSIPASSLRLCTLLSSSRRLLRRARHGDTAYRGEMALLFIVGRVRGQTCDCREVQVP